MRRVRVIGKPFGFIASAALIAATFAGSLPAGAQTAPGMSDLIGARGSSLDGELNRRGYTFAKNRGAAALWWNASRHSCISALVSNGRVDSIQTAAASDCGKVADRDIVGVAIGEAAAGLIAALSGHHHHQGHRNNNAAYNSEYERGYNDAFYGSHYAKHDSEPYHSGYMAGEAERNNRRHANSTLVRGAPENAEWACAEKGDEYWGIPPGSATPVNVFDYGQGNYEVVVISGHRRANCSVTADGKVTDFNAPAGESSPVVSKPESDCLAVVANEVGNGDVSTIDIKHGENQITVRVRVPGAQAPWICEHDSRKVTNAYYSTEG